MKKLTSIILSATMLLSLVACTPQNEIDNEIPEITEPVTQETGDPNVNPAGEFPIVKEPITLKVLASQMANVEDLKTNDFTKRLEELTNIKLEWEIVPATSAQERLNVLLATGGDLPDILLGFDIKMPQQIAFGEEQQMFVDMSPYLDTYAPNIKEVYEDVPLLEDMSRTPNGGLYAISGVEETYHVKFQQKAWIQNSYLEALDTELPTNTDEFKDLLIAIRDEDPNGNGEQDEIPYIGATTGWSLPIVPFTMSAFIDYYNIDGVPTDIAFTVEDGNIEIAADKDGFKEGLMYLNDLVNEGLLDPLSFTQDQKQLKTLTGNENDIVGIFTAGAPGGGVNGADNQLKWTAVPPLEGPSGENYTRYIPMSLSYGRYAITNQCENVEAAVRLVDYLMSREGTLNSSIGVEGVDWEWNTDENVKGLNGDTAVYIRHTPYGVQQNVNWDKMAPLNLVDEFRNGQAAPEGASNIEGMLYKESEEKYAPVNTEKYILPVAIPDEDQNDFTDISTSLETYLKQSVAEFVVGVRSFDDWDTHVATIESMGAERFEEIINNAYANQYGTLGLE